MPSQPKSWTEKAWLRIHLLNVDIFYKKAVNIVISSQG